MTNYRTEALRLAHDNTISARFVIERAEVYAEFLAGFTKPSLANIPVAVANDPTVGDRARSFMKIGRAHV